MTSKNGGFLERFARGATYWAGSSWALAAALGVIILWGLTGPLFGFSDTWQLVINTSTTIVTFLMVFLIQRSQNKDGQAVQLKLNEMVAAVRGASNRLINVEDLSEKEVEGLHRHYQKLVELAKGERDLTESHSVEEAEGRHRSKRGTGRLKGLSRQRDVGPGRAFGVEASDVNGTNRSHARGGEEARLSRLDNRRQKPDNPAGAVNGTQGEEQAEPIAEEAEVARFLRAAEMLRARIRWHQRQITEHQKQMAGVKDMLIRHGVRLKALFQVHEEDQVERQPSQATDRDESPTREGEAR